MCEGDRRQGECALPGRHGLPLLAQSRPRPQDLRQAQGHVTWDGPGSGRGPRRKPWARPRSCASLALARPVPSSSQGKELCWSPLPLLGLPPLVPKMQSELTACCPVPSMAPQYPPDHGPEAGAARSLDLSLFHKAPLPGLQADSPLPGTPPAQGTSTGLPPGLPTASSPT